MTKSDPNEVTKLAQDTIAFLDEQHMDELPALTGAATEIVLQEFICERCGYHYKKAQDFAPLLCYRCMRFIAKKTWTIMHTIQPPTSRTVVAEV